MSFKIIRNDLTKVKADSIVNFVNSKPRAMIGTNQAVYDATGFDFLLQERIKIDDIYLGEAAVTSTFNLKANNDQFN